MSHGHAVFKSWLITALTHEEVVKRYKSLADIVRGFRVLKSEQAVIKRKDVTRLSPRDRNWMLNPIAPTFLWIGVKNSCDEFLVCALVAWQSMLNIRERNWASYF